MYIRLKKSIISAIYNYFIVKGFWGFGVGVGDGVLGEGEVPLLVQFIPQKVELVKPEGLDPSILYITDYPFVLKIVLFLCFEYTTKVNSFD